MKKFTHTGEIRYKKIRLEGKQQVRVAGVTLYTMKTTPSTLPALYEVVGGQRAVVSEAVIGEFLSTKADKNCEYLYFTTDGLAALVTWKTWEEPQEWYTNKIGINSSSGCHQGRVIISGYLPV